MKLYFSPGACSMVARMALRYVEATFEAVPVELSSGDQRSPGFLAINPKGKVPTLVRDDGSVLTELGTILFWIASTFPQAGLLPTGVEPRIRIQEAVEYCISTLHALGTTRIFVPSAFGAQDQEEAVKTEGRRILADGLLILDARFSDGEHFCERLSIADFMIYWLALGAVMSGLDLPPAVRRNYTAMENIAAVRSSLVDEGFG